MLSEKKENENSNPRRILNFSPADNFNFFSLPNFPLEKKRVLLRVDFNVPLEANSSPNSHLKVKDDRKIRLTLPTIKYLLQKKCQLIICTHLGRPEGKVVDSLRVNPLAQELQLHFPRYKITKLNDCLGQLVRTKVNQAKPREIILLENLRFHPEEEANDSFFAHSLANLAEVYVNDAFGACHQKNASIQAITQYLPSVAGFLVQEEINQLHQALKPQRPAVWILGGSKLNKINLLKQALKQADIILIGGAIAFSFLKAKKIPVGMSKIDRSSVKLAKKILNQRLAKKIVLPIDIIAADSFSPQSRTEIVASNQIKNHQIGLDLGPNTIEKYKLILKNARTIVWNGPLGYFEWVQFANATREIGRFISSLPAYTICGGGETAEAIQKFHLEHKITYLSSGGGAALAFLSGEQLPGLKALEKNYRKFRKKIGIR
ncbi:MAG TPA: phosphoglycerate kinase [Candidatus Nanoarchaeia archaeon]|nr:phosphoglycerate kinase [Candidatus Nanoarchaeia archaeon]